MSPTGPAGATAAGGAWAAGGAVQPVQASSVCGVMARQGRCVANAGVRGAAPRAAMAQVEALVCPPASFPLPPFRSDPLSPVSSPSPGVRSSARRLRSSAPSRQAGRRCRDRTRRAGWRFLRWPPRRRRRYWTRPQRWKVTSRWARFDTRSPRECAGDRAVALGERSGGSKEQSAFIWGRTARLPMRIGFGNLNSGHPRVDGRGDRAVAAVTSRRSGVWA